MTVHPYRFDRATARWNRLFNVRPATSQVSVVDGRLLATFGPWSLETDVANVVLASTTGPYRRWRVAGPARMSLADRGITFATNTEQGLCLTFAEPVAGIEPFGVLRHPTLTVTVDDLPALAAELGIEGELVHTDLARGSLLSVAHALRRSLIKRRKVAVAPPLVDTASPDAEFPADGQRGESGVGPWFHRRYSVEIVGPKLTPHELIEAIQRDPNIISDTTLAPFVKDDGVVGEMDIGDRYTVRTAGPWDGPVEVVDLGPDHLRFATLDGHMEAGIIDIHATGDAGSIGFEIESWARSGDRAFHVLYDLVGVAKSVQTEMWVSACERAAEYAGGRMGGPVAVMETRTNADEAS